MMITKSKACNIALFVDYENVAKQNGHRLESILKQASAEGALVVLRAYADWQQFSAHRQRLQSLGFELIEIPSNNGKNSADIKLTVDALEIAFTKDFVDAFVIVSGDSDFVPLVVKLNELNRRAWLYVANTNAASRLKKFCHRLVLAPPRQSPKPEQNSVTQNSKPALTSRKTDSADDGQSVPSWPLKHVAESTLLTVVWAIQACEDVARAPHPLPWLFAAIQRLDPSFDLRRLMGTRNRTRIRFANYVRDRGLIVLDFDRAGNQYFFRATERAKQLADGTTADAARMASAMDEIRARIQRARVLAEKLPTKVDPPADPLTSEEAPFRRNSPVQLSLFDG